MRQVLRLVALVALVLGGLTITATAAQAKSVECNEAGQCTVRCTQTLPDGAYVEYEEGTTITITTADGQVYKYKCQNGNWVKQAALVVGVQLLGTIGPVSVGGVKLEGADVTADKAGLYLTRRPDRTTCNPTDVACP